MNYKETLKEMEKLLCLTHIAMNVYDHRSSNPIYGKDKSQDVHIHLFNYILFQYEILIRFHESIKIMYTPESFEELDIYPDIKERLIYIQTTAFIKTVSSMEYVFKQWLANNNKAGTEINKCFKRKHQTFGGIVNAMKLDKYLLDDIVKTLENINFLRNCIVHNDSISQENITIKIGPVEIKCIIDNVIEFGVFDLTFVNIKLIDVFDEFYCKILGAKMINLFPERTNFCNKFLEDIYCGKIEFEDMDKFAKQAL